MKKHLFIACLLSMALHAYAQSTRIMAFPITDYIVAAGDSVLVVQVKLPAGLQIKMNNYCLIKSRYKANGDSVITVGTGKCRLIKSEYYYFAFLNKDLLRKPVAGELLFTDVLAPAVYQGALFDATKYSVTLNSLEEKLIADLDTVLQMKTADDEKPVIAMLTADIKYTAETMDKQNNGQDRMIEKGKFKGKKLFATMQSITDADVKDFLVYIGYRPELYAGNTWKFSEIMATWIIQGAPVYGR
jgi:hypothetical protein